MDRDTVVMLKTELGYKRQYFSRSEPCGGAAKIHRIFRRLLTGQLLFAHFLYGWVAFLSKGNGSWSEMVWERSPFGVCNTATMWKSYHNGEKTKQKADLLFGQKFQKWRHIVSIFTLTKASLNYINYKKATTSWSPPPALHLGATKH